MAVFALLAYITVFAQTDSERYAQRYDLLVSKLDQIKTDGVIVESLQKSVSTTANVNARFKRVCEIMGE